MYNIIARAQRSYTFKVHILCIRLCARARVYVCLCISMDVTSFCNAMRPCTHHVCNHANSAIAIAIRICHTENDRPIKHQTVTGLQTTQHTCMYGIELTVRYGNG